MVELAEAIEIERPQEKLVRRLCTLLSIYLDQSQIDEVSIRLYKK